MKWLTHKTFALGTGISLNFPPEAIGSMVFGAILPDIIDMNFAGKGQAKQRIFCRIHRGFSHWYGWYFFILLFCFFYPMTNFVKFIIMGCALGAISHIILDMLTPLGIPLTPSILTNRKKVKRISLNLCSTGSFKEYIFLALSIALFWFFSGDKILNTFQKSLNSIAF